MDYIWLDVLVGYFITVGRYIGNRMRYSSAIGVLLVIVHLLVLLFALCILFYPFG